MDEDMKNICFICGLDRAIVNLKKYFNYSLIDLQKVLKHT